MGFSLSNIQLTSANFTPDGAIPVKHTGEGDDVSPALFWENIPQGTKSIAVFCHDPDAPKISTQGNYGFVHWLVYNIPPSTTKLDEGVKGFAHGVNDMGEHAYNGPMPPEGHGQHRYYFWVLALDLEPALPDGLDLCEFLEKVEAHTLGMNRLVGTYQR